MEIVEVIDKVNSVTTKAFSKTEVIRFLNMVSQKPKNKPSTLKKGDVYVFPIAFKIRPCVVIKVFESYVYSIPLSTTKDELNLCKFNSRFFGEHYFSNSICITKVENAIKGFVGVLDDNIRLNKAIRMLKENVEKL